jgi:hypothetical protein
MKRIFTALTLIIGLHLVSASSTAHADERFYLMTPKSARGVGANCLIPDSFYLSFSRNDKGKIKFGKQKVRARGRNATFTATRAQKKIGRVITTRIRGEKVTVTEFAANLKDKASCTYTFQSQRVS